MTALTCNHCGSATRPAHASKGWWVCLANPNHTGPAPIDLDGWLVLDSENNALLVQRLNPNEPTLWICDVCFDVPIDYWMVKADGTMINVGYCQSCLDIGRLEPTSPDRWFAPAAR